MSLNCKPGDLARVIDHPEARAFGIVDKIVRVTHIFNWHDKVLWKIDAPFSLGFGASVHGIADTILRPIRGGESPEESTEAMRDLTRTPSEVTA